MTEMRFLLKQFPPKEKQKIDELESWLQIRLNEIKKIHKKQGGKQLPKNINEMLRSQSPTC